MEAMEAARSAARSRAEATFSRVISEVAMEPEEFAGTSPSPVSPCGNPEDWRRMLELFEPSDVIWIGEKHDSGGTRHRRNFRPREDWMRLSRPLGPLIVPSVFKAGAFSRSQEFLERRRFLVVESDELPKHQFLGVVRWMRSAHKLRAVVDTGGKSLHAWFDYPGESAVEGLRPILVAMRCDPATFRPTQPVRLAGVTRLETGRPQALIWYDGGDV